MLPPLPRRSGWAYCFAHSPSRVSLPRKGRRVGLRIVLFEACSAFTRVTACTLALSPIRDTLSEGFSHFVTSIAAPVASGWSGCRVGLAPTVTVYRDTLTRGFSHFVTSMTAPVASGWSGCRVGLTPLESAAFSRRTPKADFRRSSAGSIRAAPCRSAVALPMGATSNASSNENRPCANARASRAG